MTPSPLSEHRAPRLASDVALGWASMWNWAYHVRVRKVGGDERAVRMRLRARAAYDRCKVPRERRN